jgi:O-antigen/teichoic acid export membrane protein
VPITDRTLAGRAAANLARGLGGSLPLALLPPLLARQLGSAEFAVWVLVFQFAGYVAYLEFGLQTAVSKTSASSFAISGIEAVRGPAEAGARLLAYTAVAGAVGVALGTIALPVVFDIPDELTRDARLAFAVLGLGAALALPASAAHGALLGIGRNDLSAFVIVATRLPGVALTAIGASLGWSIPQLALVLASGSVLNAVMAFLVSRLVGVPIGIGGGSREQRSDIMDLTATFAVFTIATLLITGVDVVVVGFVDFDQVAAYGLGSSLVVVLAAGYTMVSTVLLPAFADAAARGDLELARRLASRSTELSSWVLVVGVVVLVALEPAITAVWAGEFADDAGVIFVVLSIATAVRLSVSPLAQYIIGIGEHRMVRLPAAGEALTNLVLSVGLGLWIGAAGVAIATLVAAVGTALFYVVRLAPVALGALESRRLVRSAFLGPLVLAAVCVPFVLLRVPGVTAAFLVMAAAVGAARVRGLRRNGQGPVAASS